MAKKQKKDKAESTARAADVEKLRRTVARLEDEVAKQQRKKARWKQEAKTERTRSARLETALRRSRREQPADHAPADHGDVPVDPPVTELDPGERPDESWTVTRLRARARAQGLQGYSRATKAQLLAALDL